MKTSIIIPYYKGESYLRDCLESLQEQTGQDIEILLICDRVDEKDLNCLVDYADLPINVYQLQNKTGVAAARNLGLNYATGDYVYFLDSDDYLYDNTIELLILAAKERDDDIVYGKKMPTWLGRSVYLSRKQDETSEEMEDDEESSSNIDRLRSEDDVEEEKGRFIEDSAEEAAEDYVEEEDSKKHSQKTGYDPTDSEYEKNSDTYHEQTLVTLSEEEQQRLIEVYQRQAYRILVSKRKGIRKISVLNILIKRSFLEENKIRFPENLLYLSDVPFLLEALSKTNKCKRCLAAKYIKRKHNDPINLPSLSQTKDPNRFYEFIDAYYETAQRIPKNSELKDFLDMKYITYYCGVYAPRIKRSKNPAWREQNFICMYKIIREINPEILHSLTGYKKYIIKALIQKNVQKSLLIVELHLGYRKLKKILKSRKAFAKFLYIHFFIKRPLKQNAVLFESFFGKNYTGNPKYIYEYLAKNYPGKYEFIWVIDKKNTHIPFRHKEIRRYGILYSYYLARCKYIVFNVRQPDWVIKREESIFLQTWHGTPLKKLVFDIEEISSASPKYKQQFYKQSRAWDYLIAPNAFSSETFRRCFMYENTMLETGYPRNDIMHAPNLEVISKKIKTQLQIPLDKKVILYAPTWRDDEFYAKGQYKFELHLNLDMMKEQLGEQYVLLLRTHYFIADSIDVTAFKGFAYNLSRYDDISELYLISDILITDYSSVFFDYANLKRPMLFFTYDLEKYRDILRGFYFDIEKEVPGPLLYTTDEIVDAVRNIDTIHGQYSQRYEEFYKRFCEWEDGHAAEKVVKSVFVK